LTLRVQEPDGARLVPQVVVSEKSPTVLMLAIESGDAPSFVMVTVCGTEADPTKVVTEKINPG
jgi:hypothetical protein